MTAAGGAPLDSGPVDGVAVDELSYEELIAALEELTEKMAAGTIGIEEATDLYEMAGILHAAAAARLAAVQERIAKLRSDLDA